MWKLINHALIISLIIPIISGDDTNLYKYYKDNYNDYHPKVINNVSVNEELSDRLFHFMAGGLSDIVWSTIPEIIRNRRQ